MKFKEKTRQSAENKQTFGLTGKNEQFTICDLLFHLFLRFFFLKLSLCVENVLYSKNIKYFTS